MYIRQGLGRWGVPAWPINWALAPRQHADSCCETRRGLVFNFHLVSQWLTHCFPTTCHSARLSPLLHRTHTRPLGWKGDRCGGLTYLVAQGTTSECALKSFFCVRWHCRLRRTRWCRWDKHKTHLTCSITRILHETSPLWRGDRGTRQTWFATNQQVLLMNFQVACTHRL